MTEPSPTEIHFSKAQPPSQEVQKRKKTSKKKPEPKPSNPRLEPLEGVIPDLNTEADFDLIHYTYKLEQQLSRVKKQLRLQKKNFRDVIHGLAKYFDDNGVSSQVVEEYIESLGTQIVDQQDRECEYEKFFTVHKYHIVEDPNTFNTKFVPKSGQKAENGPKNVPKSMNSSVKLDSGEQNPNDVSLEKIEKAEKAEKTEKSEKKKGRPPSKPSNSSANGTEEAPKKRKYTKHKQSEEGGGNMIPDIQEIPPFSPVKEVQKRSENKVKRAEDMIRGYEEMGQKPMDMSMLGPAAYGLDDGLKALMKQMNMDPSALMNPYIAGNFGLQEGDIYNKMLQELMKTSAPTAMLNTDKARQDLFNYYQGAFK